MMSTLIPAEQIERKIFLIRGHKVMLDSDLAELYGVQTKALTRAVKRNLDRFPEDFMFQLTPDEVEALRRQFGTSKGRGGRRYRPYVFAKQGVAMLSSVLRSKRAVRVNIRIMRAFVKLRELIGAHKELAGKLAELERTVASHDGHIQSLFQTIRQLMKPEPPKPRRIGFHAKG
jgi:hypothetical protein